MDKAIVTCAVTGVLTNPAQHPVPVTPEEMAKAAKEAYDAGASVMHLHFRDQRPNMGFMPTWDPDIVEEIARLYGYEALGFVPPQVILSAPVLQLFATACPLPAR